MYYYDPRVFHGVQYMNPVHPAYYYQPGPYPYYPHPQAFPQRMDWYRYYPVPMAAPTGERIRHIVLFSLKPGVSAEEAGTFFSSAWQVLGSIPGVEHFNVFCQVNPQNEYKYGFTAEFANPSIYEAYRNHPAHVKWREEEWDKKVDRFLITDFKTC
ncbi:Dabb family protein [Paenibacillus alkalitolerans]|uniref:Dabb family protein n=1 Tax=Paenibacillus alkalitolerans TaxID=2799335 RepID=UPI0018F446F0|nr:Dabb family protein [Paenibacillus alkalitolerans]